MSVIAWLYALLVGLLILETIKLIRVFLSRAEIKRELPHRYPFVSVIIPARNEEKRIASCLQALALQTYPKDRYEIILVDDNSADSTGEIIESFQAEISNFVSLKAGALPDDWSGKSHACHVGSQAAHGDYLCFMDADVVSKPALLTEAVAHAVRYSDDVLSLVPYQEVVTLTEKILLLPVFIMVGSSLPKDYPVLNGQFMLFKRKTYDEIGGHTLVKNTVAEDLDFASFFHGKKYKIEFLFAEHLLSCRMYDSYAALQKGISKMIVRLMENKIGKSVWLSARYFLFACFTAVTMVLFLSGITDHLPVFEKIMIITLPVLLFAIAFGLTFYFRIFFLYGLLLPLGWLYQPVFFYHSIRGKFRKFYEWRGRKVYHE